MYESILVPLDGSRRAEAVLSYALDLAKRCDARLILFRAVPAVYQVWRETVPGTMDIAPTGAATGVEIAQREVKSRIRAARRYLGTVKQRLQRQGVAEVQTAVAEGDAGAEIIKFAHRENVGLIAIATHGRSGIVRAVMGSVADRVIRQSSMPVLVVRPTDAKTSMPK